EDSVTRLVTDIEKLHTYKDELAALLEQLKIDIPNPRNEQEGIAEIAMIQSNKTPRQCKYCLQYGFHDSRNCPKKDADMADQENNSSE
ncbi:hypothetical protein Tco_0718233, partial [Tanacetum coccineum]